MIGTSDARFFEDQCLKHQLEGSKTMGPQINESTFHDEN